MGDAEFRGKRVLVTGGTKGIGEAIVRRPPRLFTTSLKTWSTPLALAMSA